MVKGRRYRLVYSNRPPFDNREYGLHVYTPSNFDKLVSAIWRAKLEEVKKRVKVNKKGTYYRYTPSKAYLHALNKFHSH
jgi:hypothetical protein